MMFGKDFWKATAERVIRAFAVTLAAVLSVDGVLDLRSVAWGESLSIAGGAALLNLLVSVVASIGVGPVGSPSLVADVNAANNRVDPVARLADRDAQHRNPLA